MECKELKKKEVRQEDVPRLQFHRPASAARPAVSVVLTPRSTTLAITDQICQWDLV
jgi:hypothetical protein